MAEKLDRVLVDRIFELEERGKTSREIADVIGVPERTVAQRITRARRAGRERERESMANIGDLNRTRIEDLHRRGKTPEEIATLTGLSKGAVMSHLTVNVKGDARPPAKPASEQEPPRPQERPSTRALGKAFKDWEQSDYERFVEHWQSEPNFAKAAANEGLTEQEIRYIFNRLKAKGVALRPPRKWVADFEKLKALAESKLTDAEKQRIERQREHGMQQIDAMQKARRKQLAAK